MEIDLKSLEKSNLWVEDYFLLQLIHEGSDPLLFNWSGFLSDIYPRLEENGYIKILGSGDERIIELRQKAVELFGKKSDSVVIDQVLLYLNEKAGKKFSIKSAANRKFVQGRLNEGYTVDDLQKVIDTMVTEWRGTKMEDYLRPETLFNSTKFQTYINKVNKSDEWARNVK